jgi:hypothetical protein
MGGLLFPAHAANAIPSVTTPTIARRAKSLILVPFADADP